MEGHHKTTVCEECIALYFPNSSNLDNSIVLVMQEMVNAIHTIRKVNSGFLHGFFNFFPDGNIVVITKLIVRLKEIKTTPYQGDQNHFDNMRIKLGLVKQVYHDLITFVKNKKALCGNNSDYLYEAVQPLVPTFKKTFHF